jgi:uncharacterized membrane protein
MKFSKSLLLATLACAATIGWAQPVSKAPQIIMVTALDAGTDPGQGTFANGITQKGTVAGWYVDKYGVSHGFVRTLDGAFTTVDGPNALLSWVEGMNSYGEAAGYYADANITWHGLLWSPKTGLSTFDIPGAGTGFAQGTYAANINDSGTVNGLYFDSIGMIHGFLRKKNGDVTTFEVPGAAVFNVYPGTFYGLSNAGAAVGTLYLAESPYARAWVRTQQGVLNFFDAPGAVTGTSSYGINMEGAITGAFGDESSRSHGFLLDKNGNYEEFDSPDPAGTGIFPCCLNASKQIVGYYLDAKGAHHGFVGMADGTIKTIDVAGAGTDKDMGTTIFGINAQGWLMGWIVDNNNVTKSFVMLP